MAAAHTAQMHDHEDSALKGVFCAAAGAAVLGAAGLISAPLTLAFGAVAAVSGIGLAAKSLPSDSPALVAAFTAAVTTFALGIPTEFISEAIVFPWAHDTNFGGTVMQKSGEFLVPIYDTIGKFFGIQPYNELNTDLPVF